MKIHMIYLAAGSSRRFGGNKLLWEYEGRPLFRHGLDRLIEMAADRCDCTITVVTRYDEILKYTETRALMSSAVHDAGTNARTCTDIDIRAVYSPLSHLGASFSIRAALHDIDFISGDYFMFMVADQPRISRRTLDAVADAAYSGCLTASASYGERCGNPVLFSASLADELLALSGDTGGRQVLRAHPENHIDIIAGSPEELEDIDNRP